MTEITMSGSPIAWAFIGLWEVLKIPANNLMSIILWTRWWVNSVLLITGLLMLLKWKSLRRALGITVIQFFVTLSVTLLSATFVFQLLKLDIFANIWDLLTSSITSSIGVWNLIEIVVNTFKLHIPWIINLLIIWLILLVWWLFAFDQNFSFVKDEHIAKKIRKIESTQTAFLAGFILTALTMSLSISVTLLLPLYMRKVITRRHLIPYILGANISTLFDTLFLAIMTDSVIWIRVILAFITATIISVCIILFGFQYYRKIITFLTDTILDNKYYFILFLIIIMFIPLLFLFG
jgi:sodium-dependent phosphate cotransporter